MALKSRLRVGKCATVTPGNAVDAVAVMRASQSSFSSGLVLANEPRKVEFDWKRW